MARTALLAALLVAATFVAGASAFAEPLKFRMHRDFAGTRSRARRSLMGHETHTRGDPLVTPGTYNGYGYDTRIRSNYLDDGSYYCEVNVGGSKGLKVQIDTGSGDLAVVGTHCGKGSAKAEARCNVVKRAAVYDPATSAQALKCGDAGNSKWLQPAATGAMSECGAQAKAPGTCSPGKQCTNMVKYGDGDAWTGDVYVDKVSIGDVADGGNTPAVDAVVTAITNFTETFAAYASGALDGIMGMAPSLQQAQTGALTVFEQLVAHHDVENAFSMCFDDTDGGVFTLGGDGGHVAHGAMQWTPILPYNATPHHTYAIEFAAGKLGDAVLAPFNGEKAIVDSGNSAIRLRPELYDAFAAALVNLCTTPEGGTSSVAYLGLCVAGENPPNHPFPAGTKLTPTVANGMNNTIFSGMCHKLSDADIAKYPSLTIHVPDMEKGGDAVLELVLEPHHFIRNAFGNCPKGYVNAKAVQRDEATGTSLGDAWMENWLMVFNLTEPRRLGFATTTKCSMDGAVNPTTSPGTDGDKLSTGEDPGGDNSTSGENITGIPLTPRPTTPKKKFVALGVAAVCTGAVLTALGLAVARQGGDGGAAASGATAV